MKLKRFLLRYYPPGVILEYELRDKSREMKEIDLLHLTANADVDVIVNQIVAEEPLISESKKPHLRKLLYSTFYILLDWLLNLILLFDNHHHLFLTFLYVFFSLFLYF